METDLDIPRTGFIRQKKVLEFFPFGHSTLWKKVGDGTFPAPVKISANITAWRVEDIRAEIARLGQREGA